MNWEEEGEPVSEAQLGRYTLLTRIAEGELTTVYLARQQSDTGFTRLVALKRLHPELADQREYVDLLKDEAYIGAGLNHANVVAAIDVGTAPGECFLTFEYVEGDSLAGLLERANAACHPRFLAPLFVDVLSGLHAAHNVLGATGEPITLVHQAPRAEHILVGIDGIARLADFGQVRSPTLRPNRLRTDRLRIGYMAPEQLVRPDVVDHRTDIFIVGTALWEALTGRRLFESYSEEQSFQNLLHRAVPAPSEINRALPSCFDEICLRALEREPSARYDTAADMARELRDTAINNALFATAPEIGQWVKSLCGEQLVERRRLAGSESPSQRARVDTLPAQPALRFEQPGTHAPGPHEDEGSQVTTPFYDEEVTTLHLAPPSPDSDDVPILLDELDEDSQTLTHPSLQDESVVSAIPVPEGYDRYPDSGELPDFSESDHDGPTRVFEGLSGEEEAPDGRPSLSEHEVPTRVMPAPSERASAFAREYAARSKSTPPPAGEASATPAYGTSLWMPDQARAGAPSGPPLSAPPPPAAPSSVPGHAARRSSRSSGVREESAGAGARRDSIPVRMPLSAGPVGNVFGASEPPAHEAPPSAEAPVAIRHADPPRAPAQPAPAPTPDAPLGAGVLPDSLTPPSQSHALPGDVDLTPRSRAKPLLVVAVLAAAAVALGWVLIQPGAPGASQAGQPDRIDDPSFVDEGDEIILEVDESGISAAEKAAATGEPQAMQAAGEPAEEDETGDAEAAQAEALQARPGASPTVASGPSGAGAPATKRPAPKAKANRRSKPRRTAPRPVSTPAVEPAAKPAPRAGDPDWRGRGQEIPDNPF